MTSAYLLKRGRPGQPPKDIHETLDFKGTVATDSGAYQILEYGHVGVRPAEIVAYQEKIDTDIGVILDLPTGFHSDARRAGWTVDETVRRADEALKRIKRKDILWVGPVQEESTSKKSLGPPSRWENDHSQSTRSVAPPS